MRCQGKKIKGSGYTKSLTTNNSLGLGLASDIQVLLAARAAQDAHYFPSTGAQATVVTSATAHPVEPNPPAPLSVVGPGRASTTTTSSQGLKSPAASCTSRS